MAKFNLVALLCMVLLAVGCGQSAEERAMEEQIEKETAADTDVDVSKKGMKVTGETEGGEYTVTTGGKTEIPKNFPADVFIYRPSKAVMAMEIPEGHSIALTTQDDQSKVLSAYKREMTAKGWSEETSMNMGSQSVLVYEKNGRAANISVVPSEKEVQINVTVTTQ
ncbi:MAG: hypothetical protein ACLFVT_06430 [Syntrophobacteria bacterium]